MTEINNVYTSFIVCPYCGAEDQDCWEIKDNDGFIQCGSCEKKFYYERDISISYTTWTEEEKKRIEEESK